jgi:hypothetical protein
VPLEMFNTISFTGTFIALKGEKIKDLFQPKYCFTQAETENQMPKLSLLIRKKVTYFSQNIALHNLKQRIKCQNSLFYIRKKEEACSSFP